MPGKAKSMADVENSSSKSSAPRDANKLAAARNPSSNIGQTAATSVDRQARQVQSAKVKPEVKGERKVTLSETSPPGHVQRRNSPRKQKSSPVKRPEVKGEIKVTLSESSPPSRAVRRNSPRKRPEVRGEIKVTLSESPPPGHAQRRNSPKKSKSSATKNEQRRASPRRQAQKPSAAKGIQMYMKNLKNSQKKGKKPISNQKVRF